jgi:hypothetical protein
VECILFVSRRPDATESTEASRYVDIPMEARVGPQLIVLHLLYKIGYARPISLTCCIEMIDMLNNVSVLLRQTSS